MGGSQDPGLAEDGGGAEELAGAEEGGHPGPLVLTGQLTTHDLAAEAAGVGQAAGGGLGLGADGHVAALEVEVRLDGALDGADDELLEINVGADIGRESL